MQAMMSSDGDSGVEPSRLALGLNESAPGALQGAVISRIQ
jgi:hypothetical protein